MKKYTTFSDAYHNKPSLSQFMSSSINRNNDGSPSELANNYVKIINATYTIDYDINEIHDQVLKNFKYEKLMVETYRKKILKLENKSDKKINKIKKNKNDKKIHDLNVKINDILGNVTENDYLNKSKPYLDEYNRIGRLRYNFGSQSEVIDQHKNVRHKIITDYFDFVKKYIKLNIVHEQPNTILCEECGEDLKECSNNNENGYILCIKCKAVKPCPVRVSYINENSTNSGYEDRDNFIKALLRDQGLLTNGRPTSEVVEILNKHFESYGLPLTSKDILPLPLNKDGRKDGTNKSILFKALKDTNLSSYIADSNTIAVTLWGWTPCDYSDIIDLVIADYDKLQPFYVKIKSEYNRKSSLNVEFRRFKQLQMRGYPCDYSDFKELSTDCIEQDHKKIWALLIEMAQTVYPDDGFVYYD